MKQHRRLSHRLAPIVSVVSALACVLSVSPAQAKDDAAQIKRGAALLAFGGCGDCHTPFKMGPNGPEKDLSRGLSGHPAGLEMTPAPKLDGPWGWAGAATNTAFAGPWGTSYATNLTPDLATGIGNWRPQDFIQAMRTGKHLGAGRPILPPMPWQAVGSLSDKDLTALYTYLMAQPAVKNKVPEALPPGK